MVRYPLSRWWGWGDERKTYSLHERPSFLPFLKSALNLSTLRESPPPSLETISLPDSRLDGSIREELEVLLGAEGVSTRREDRVRHAVGRGYRDLLTLRLGRVDHAPDAVAFPADEYQVERLVEFAARRKLCLVPVGGATSVVGGIEPVEAGQCAGIVSVNMTRMNRVLDIDRRSLTVRVEPGVYGPDLEEKLNKSGLSLGHFPESFHYSTVGGWMAASSSGQNSTLYGRMADLVLGLRMITPLGVLDTGMFPAHAQGPDLKHLLLGSEGIFGIITQARLKIHLLPRYSHFSALLFPDFERGAEAARRMIQAGLTPAVLRLSDARETDMALALWSEPSLPAARVLKSLFFRYLSRKSLTSGRRALMILGFEGSGRLVSAQKREALRLARLDRSFYLGKTAGTQWKKHRFDHPYLRDTLMNLGLLVDTLETVTIWSNVMHVYEAVQTRILDTMNRLGTPGMVLTHLSHLYPQGSSLYFILICPRLPSREMEQWRIIKNAATEAIVDHGGAVSHHHGVGLDHAPWLKRSVGDSSWELLRRIKVAIDPYNVMNPGKLITPGSMEPSS